VFVCHAIAVLPTQMLYLNWTSPLPGPFAWCCHRGIFQSVWAPRDPQALDMGADPVLREEDKVPVFNAKHSWSGDIQVEVRRQDIVPVFNPDDEDEEF